MKKLLLLLVFLLFSLPVSAQIIPESVAKKNNLNDNSSFFEIQKAMNEYWSSLNVNSGFMPMNSEMTKVPYWKIYKRWEYFWEQRVNLITGNFPDKNIIDEFINHKTRQEQLQNASDYSENWVNLGTNSSTGGYAGLGRINCIAFHPTDANTFWIGSPSGGIWRTTNDGANWTILNNSLSVLGVSDIIIPSDYASSNTIYIATGTEAACRL